MRPEEAIASPDRYYLRVLELISQGHEQLMTVVGNLGCWDLIADGWSETLFRAKVLAAHKGIEVTVLSAVLAKKVENIMTIPSVGFLSAVTVIAETNGFALIQSRNQLTSYAGFDIKDNQSGTVEGKSRISKRGNTRIRAILYMPAVQCQRRSKHLKDAYERIVAKHPDKKMIAVTAMQLRLLLLIYASWKSNKAYSEDYNKE